MISNVRTTSKLNGIAGLDTPYGLSDKENQEKFSKFGSSEGSKEDKQVIKKLERELDEAKRKMNTMRRNYDALSHNAHGDKADAAKV